MKLNNFLDKENEYKKIIDIIMSRVSKEYLNACISSGKIPKRVESGKSIITYEIFNTYENRKPTNTKQEISNLLDEIFKKLFGWKARSEYTAFAFNKVQSNSIQYYSNFFPLDTLKYVYSPTVGDLYIDLYDSMQYVENSDLNNAIQNWIKENKYTNKNLESILKEQKICEIMFQCKQYLMINSIYLDTPKLLSLIKKEL